MELEKTRISQLGKEIETEGGQGAGMGVGLGLGRRSEWCGMG